MLKKTLSLLAACCLALCSVAGARATGTAAPNPQSVIGNPPSPAYVFVTGDVIDITVRPQEGYDRTVTIQPDGKMAFPIVGEVQAAGMTVQQLQETLERGLLAELKRPKVTVSLKEINKGLLRRVTVMGAVKAVGVFELKEHATLAEMLATAGGTLSVADLRKITITRADGGVKVADLSRSVRTGEVTDNVLLEPGDLIYVPEGVPPTVLVLGEVGKPSSYELQGEMRLLDALSLAGGPTDKADLQRVTLTRAGQTESEIINLQDLLTKGQQKDLSKNLILQPGDTVVIPESERKFYVLGEVNKAEAYPLKPGDRLLDAITTAGGSTHEADLSKVVLVRKDAKGQLQRRQLDLKKMMSKGDLSRNEALIEGDVIYVPSRKPKGPLSDLATLLYPISGLLNVLRLY